MAATRTDTEVYARDITEAYVQSRSCLERKIFLKPPSEMKLPDQKILLALKPLYGQPEAGQHWFFTYSEQHKRELEMQSSTTDKCVLYCASTSSPLLDVVILQVDDSYEIGNKEFLDQQNASTDQFRTKPRKFLKPGGSCLFNGYCIEQEEYGSVRMQQKKKGEPELIGDCSLHRRIIRELRQAHIPARFSRRTRDHNGNPNILSYGSKKSGRVTRGFMAPELLALVHGYDQSYIAKNMLEEMLQREMHIAAYIDSGTVFNSVAKHKSTSKTLLAVDMAALRE
ncbi:hypothetical protein BWQ96_05815 [Gracilariopsis chorda]|uniref:Uncharacterized protein n=1 Tax=Gracilariopsis chorda TaxID=448386 RepID=A0A2V3IQQ5_9FLOR|nr:hypothetical protein BWQ96_05815 [Gracilariopsis chorda]|eukprot:PXF44445.1 hypothetical protein BWQ96_05815 [Gracilariopsis chorda]